MTSKTNKKLESIKKVKGMHDILPKEYWATEKFVEKMKTIAEFYGFKPIQTPHLEKAELFSRTLGETTDIIEKEIYGLKTKGGDKLVLRPELTASILRAYLEHGMYTKPQPVMFYSYGSCFRHEKAQKGRRREFQQFDMEILGEKDPIAEATIIKVSLAILEEVFGLKSVTVRINSVGDIECRKTYQKELVAYYRKKAKQLCPNCLRRLKTNPLRLLDCKEEGCIKMKKDAPQIINYLCDECTKHFKELLEVLDGSKISYYLDHYLVRGLDYYSRSAFEFITEESSLELGGGGRYDPLSSVLGKREVPGVGVALGISRIVELLAENDKLPIHKKTAKIFFIQLGIEAKRKSLEVLEILRKAKIPTKHSLSKNSIKGQLKAASRLNIPHALIFGQKEALEDSVIIRDMKNSSQETVPLEQLVDTLKKKI